MFCASHPVSRESTIRQKAGLQALMQSDGSNFRREAYFQQEHLLLVWKAGTSSRRLGADGTGKFLLLSSQSRGERGSPPRQIACWGVPPSRAASPHCVPTLPSLLAPKRAGREKRALIVGRSESKPDLAAVPEATPRAVTPSSIPRVPAEPRPVWRGEVRAVRGADGGEGGKCPCDRRRKEERLS